MIPSRLVVILSIWLLALPVAGADLYTWTDKSGNVHFSDMPPPTGTSKHTRVRETGCPLRSYTVRFGEDLVRKYINHFGGPYMSKDRSGIRAEHLALFDTVISEKDKCYAGDREACSCITDPAGTGAQPPVAGGKPLQPTSPR